MNNSVFASLVLRTNEYSPIAWESILSSIEIKYFCIVFNGINELETESIRNSIYEKSKNICTIFLNTHENIGFAGGQNLAVAEFLKTECKYFLTLNPDLVITKDLSKFLLETLEQDATAGLATPLLLRANIDLTPVQPSIIDAAGMVLTNTLRHLDRDSEKAFIPNSYKKEYVFGGTGACLMLSRVCIEKLILKELAHESDANLIYPALLIDSEKRAKLFDEAFFAYREDADLAWRAGILGFKCIFEPKAIGYHERSVTPERRSIINSEVNSSSVRNRFLMQINNFNFKTNTVSQLMFGLCVWNIIVFFGVLIRERSSIKGLKQVIVLFKRAIERRKKLFIAVSD